MIRRFPGAGSRGRADRGEARATQTSSCWLIAARTRRASNPDRPHAQGRLHHFTFSTRPASCRSVTTCFRFASPMGQQGGIVIPQNDAFLALRTEDKRQPRDSHKVYYGIFIGDATLHIPIH